MDPQYNPFLIELDGCILMVELHPYSHFSMTRLEKGSYWECYLVQAQEGVDVKAVKEKVREQLPKLPGAFLDRMWNPIEKPVLEGDPAEHLARLTGGRTFTNLEDFPKFAREDIKIATVPPAKFAGVQFYANIGIYPFRIYKSPPVGRERELWLDKSSIWRAEYRGPDSFPPEIRERVDTALTLLNKTNDWAGLSSKEFFEKVVSSEE